MTSPPSQPTGCEPTDAGRTSSWEALRAKMRARRTLAERESTEKKPASSSIGSDSSRKSDPVGHVLRTFLASEIEASTGYSVAWKRSTTPAGRSWWVLSTSGRTTSESGSCLLPTPLKSTIGSHQSHRGLSRAEVQGQRGRDLASMVAAGALPMCLTPTAKDNMLAPKMIELWPGAANMAAMLPTSTKTPYGTNQGGGGRQNGSGSAVAVGHVPDADEARLAQRKGEPGDDGSQCASAQRDRTCQGNFWASSAPDFGRMDDGLSDKVARACISAYGDSFCPQVAEIVGRAILHVDGATS